MGNRTSLHGEKHQRRMAIVKLFLACVLVGCAIAHETEYYNLENDIAAPPGETYGDVEMLQEDAGSKMKEDVVYRISWNTQYDITGKVLADDDASMDCGCDPSNEAYDEVAAKWHPAGAGSVEHFYLKAVDVVTISKVTITGDAASSDSWTPGFLKVNMNDMQSGLGNGIFYMDIGKKINKDKPYIAEIGKKDAYGDKATMARKSTHNYGILQCEAAACEEKMDAKMKMSGMEAKKETKK